jgi:acyl carrier protein
MSVFEIEKTIEEFIQSNLIENLNSPNLGSADNLIETGVIDSLGIQKLLVFIEETFNLTISDDELIPDNFQSIKAISNFISQKKCVS